MGVTAISGFRDLTRKIVANFPPGKKRFTSRHRHHARLPPFAEIACAAKSSGRLLCHTVIFRNARSSAAFGIDLTNTSRQSCDNWKRRKATVS